MTPEWWSIRRLGELTDNFDAIRIPVKEADRKPGPYDYYEASGVVDHVDRYIFDGEYLLIGEDGENLRTRQTPVAFLARGKFWVNNHAHIVRGNSLADTRFLAYALQHTDLSGYLTGSTMPKLTQGNLNRIPILTPSPSEQQAIAHILGTLDDKIEVNRRMNQTLEAMGRALFKSWFVDFDPVRAKAAGRRPAGMDAATAALFPTSFVDSPMGKIPKGWECGTLRQLCDPQYGYTASAKPEGPGPKLLRVTDMNKEPWVEWEDVPHCEPDETRLSRYRLEIGDVLVSRMADPGKAAIVEEAVDAVFASYLIRLNRRWPRDSYFVFYFLRSDQYLAYAQSVTSGSVQANMNAQVITAAALLIPPPAVRQRFGDCILPLRQKIVGNLQENRQIAILRDTLLPKLLSGELCVGAIKP